MKTVYLAFYKSLGKYSDITDKAIAVWTKGPYSHVELIYEDKDSITGYTMCSAVGSKNKVRCRSHYFNNKIFDYYPVTINNVSIIKKFFNEIKNEKYDYLGILLSQLIPLGIDSNNRWFCSESCTKALQLSGINNGKLWLVKPNYINPNKLAILVGLLSYPNNKLSLLQLIPLLINSKIYTDTKDYERIFNCKINNKIM